MLNEHLGSRTNFAIASCLMLNLLMILQPPIRPNVVQQNSDQTITMTDHPMDLQHEHQQRTASFLNLQSEYRLLLDYLTRWRWAMKVASRGAGGRKGLMNLSLLRMDALLIELCSPA